MWQLIVNLDNISVSQDLLEISAHSRLYLLCLCVLITRQT